MPEDTVIASRIVTASAVFADISRDCASHGPAMVILLQLPIAAGWLQLAGRLRQLVRIADSCRSIAIDTDFAFAYFSPHTDSRHWLIFSTGPHNTPRYFTTRQGQQCHHWATEGLRLSHVTIGRCHCCQPILLLGHRISLVRAVSHSQHCQPTGEGPCTAPEMAIRSPTMAEIAL